jgi:hypothetical protein
VSLRYLRLKVLQNKYTMADAGKDKHEHVNPPQNNFSSNGKNEMQKVRGIIG